MTSGGQIWKCNVCGNVIEVLHEGADSLVCCGVPMNLISEKGSSDEGVEKHVPVISGRIVKVGSVLHPMEEKHFIEWVEAFDDKGFGMRVFLKVGDSPEAEFCFDVVSSRAYCNLHGLWKS